MGRLFEVGTPTRITRRNGCKTYAVQVYNCAFQYNGVLKAERQVHVQVVLLCIVSDRHQPVSYEVFQKYGGRDASESS